MALLATLILGIPVCLFFGTLLVVWLADGNREKAEANYKTASFFLYLFWLAGTLYYFS